MGFFDTPFGMYIMNSDSVADRVIEEFKVAIENGLNPNECQHDIYEKLRVSSSDLTDSDKRRIERTVSEIWASERNKNRYF